MNSGPTAYFSATARNMASCRSWVSSPSATKLRGRSRVAPSACSGRGRVKNTPRTMAFSLSVSERSSAPLLSVTIRSGGNSVQRPASSLSTRRHQGLSPQYR